MIYITNGHPGVGKSTFENFVKNILPDGYCYILSTVDFVKEIAAKCGWNGKKTSKDRKFLCELKNILTEWNDIPFKKIQKEVKYIEEQWKIFDIDSKKTVIFIDCREPKEIKKLCEELDAKSVLIKRDINVQEFSNEADKNVMEYNYDIIIDNNGDLEHLFEKSLDFIREQIYINK